MSVWDGVTVLYGCAQGVCKHVCVSSFHVCLCLGLACLSPLGFPCPVKREVLAGPIKH